MSNWTTIIIPRKSLLAINFRELWQYRDLLLLFVRRDFVAQYKQTILGPIWYFLQPLFTTLIFTLVFNRLAGISTDPRSGGPWVMWADTPYAHVMVPMPENR